jgi:hypothetical protein
MTWSDHCLENQSLRKELGGDAAYDAWNDATLVLDKTVKKIQRTPAEGLFGIGVKLAALAYEEHMDVIDVQIAVAAALADLDKIAETSFANYSHEQVGDLPDDDEEADDGAAVFERRKAGLP